MEKLIAIALLLSACGGTDDANVSTDAQPDCTMDSRIQTYSAGMRVAASDGVQVALLSAAPAPPVRFDNQWTVQILDAADQPMPDTELVVVPFMPDHGHGTPQPPNPVAGQDPGTYEMGPFDLWMPGVWELTFSVAHDQTTSVAIMTFCLEE